MMTEQQIKELVKTFAYGYSAEQVSQGEEISVEDAKNFQKEYNAEIVAKKAELKEGGWIE